MELKRLKQFHKRLFQGLPITKKKTNETTEETTWKKKVFFRVRNSCVCNRQPSSALSISSENCVWEMERGRELQANRVD